MVFPLCNIKPGETARIVFLGNEGGMAGRLRDLGFDSGAVVSCVMRRPRGNIAAYLVRNAVIALRAEDSRAIFVRTEVPTEPNVEAETFSMQHESESKLATDSVISIQSESGPDAEVRP